MIYMVGGYKTVAPKKGKTMTTREKIRRIEQRLKVKRFDYNYCNSFSKRVKLNREIEQLYKKLAIAYKKLGEEEKNDD